MPPPLTIVLATGNPHKVDELRAIFAGFGTGATRSLTIVGLADLPDHERFTEPEETGTTFAANARIKALAYAEQIGGGVGSREEGSRDHGIMGSRIGLDPTVPRSLGPTVLCLADDSGLEIDALALPDGTPRPGVISSHYFNDNQPTTLARAERDQANNARVLRELEGVPIEKRTARFVCCMCLARVTGRGSRVAGDAAPARSHDPTIPRSLPLHETRGTFEGRIGTPPRVPAGTNGFGYDPLFLVAPDFTRTGAELSSEEKNTLSHRAMAAREMAAWLLSTTR